MRRNWRQIEHHVFAAIARCTRNPNCCNGRGTTSTLDLSGLDLGCQTRKFLIFAFSRWTSDRLSSLLDCFGNISGLPLCVTLLLLGLRRHFPKLPANVEENVRSIKGTRRVLISTSRPIVIISVAKNIISKPKHVRGRACLIQLEHFLVRIASIHDGQKKARRHIIRCLPLLAHLHCEVQSVGATIEGDEGFKAVQLCSASQEGLQHLEGGRHFGHE